MEETAEALRNREGPPVMGLVASLNWVAFSVLRRRSSLRIISLLPLRRPMPCPLHHTFLPWGKQLPRALAWTWLALSADIARLKLIIDTSVPTMA
jgi:hypothetical protein